MDFTPENLMKIVNEKKFVVGEVYLIDVTYIKDPYNFYVRPAEYFEYMPAIGKPGEALQSSEIHIGLEVCYMSRSEEFIRGVIMGETNDCPKTYSIFAPDFGYTEVDIDLKDIRKRLCNLKIPNLISKCKLADSRPREETWSQEAIDAMKEFVTKDYIKMTVQIQTPDLLTVHLQGWKGPDVSMMMAFAGFSTLFASSSYTMQTGPENSKKLSISNQRNGPGTSK